MRMKISNLMRKGLCMLLLYQYIALSKDIHQRSNLLQ